MQNKANGIEKVLTGKEAESKGADPHCAFMIEARLGYYIKEELSEEFIDHIIRKTWHSPSP